MSIDRFMAFFFYGMALAYGLMWVIEDDTLNGVMGMLCLLYADNRLRAAE